MKRFALVLVLAFLGCTSPEKVVVMPSTEAMLSGPAMPTIEYRCPLCTSRYKTEYLAQQCIDQHETEGCCPGE